MKLETLDILIAHKVINLASELSAADKAVAGAIVDHFNRSTGRCDPSVDRIARLLRLSERTVIRATNRLAVVGFIIKVTHQGHFHCNAYMPNWYKFRQRNSEWTQRFRSLNNEEPKLSPEGRQICQVEGDDSVRQTTSNNQSNLTNKRCCDEANGSTHHASKGQSAIVARSAAERRWNTDLFKRYAPHSELYSIIVETVDLAMQAGATDAEFKRRGSGVDWLLNALRARGVGV